MLVTRSALAPVLLAASLVFMAAAPISTFALESGQQCNNCFDDDSDGVADRKDPDCPPPPANGAGAGLGDVVRGKIVSTCVKNTQKAGVKFALAVIKRFQKCTLTSEACIQAKSGDAGCQAKATAACAKAVDGFDALAAKFQATVVAKCDPNAQNIADIQAVAGLGFSAEQTPCVNETDVPDLSTIQNVASCMAQQHFCNAQHLVAAASPRAREFLTFAGRQPSEFPCIEDRFAGANGGGTIVEAAHVKPLLKCSKAINKLLISLLGAGAKTVQTCLNAGITCLQVKPADQQQACLDKTRAKCDAVFDKLQNPLKGTVTKIATKFQKACGVQANFDLNDFRQANGIGFDAELARCTQLGSTNPVFCFGSQLFCEGGYVLEREIPRARELAALLGVEIPGFEP